MRLGLFQRAIASGTATVFESHEVRQLTPLWAVSAVHRQRKADGEICKSNREDQRDQCHDSSLVPTIQPDSALIVGQKQGA